MTQRDYMRTLQRGIRWHCGAREAAEIRADYEAAFEDGQAQGKGAETLLQEFGDPEQAAAILRREWGAPFYRLPPVRALCLLAAVLSTVAYALGYSEWWPNGYFLILLAPLAIYIGMGGPEARANPAQGGGRAWIWAACGAIVLFVGAFALVGSGAWRNRMDGAFFAVSALAVLAAVAAWLLARRSRVAATPLYASAFLLMGGVIAVIDLNLAYEDAFEWVAGWIACDLVVGVCGALAFAFVLRLLPSPEQPQRDRAERLARVKRIGVQAGDPVQMLFLDELYRRLRFWFSNEERQEILEDYSECFAAGLEEGESAQTLCGRFGAPQAIVRILRRERPGRLAFPARVAAGVLAAFLLREMFSTYNSALFLHSLQSWPAVLFMVMLPPLLVMACAGGGAPENQPAAKQRGWVLLPFYLATAALFCVPILSVPLTEQDWLRIPPYLGPLFHAALYCGVAVTGAASCLALYACGGKYTPMLFLNAGFLLTASQLLEVFNTLSDGAMLHRMILLSLRPILVGAALSLLAVPLIRQIRRGGTGGLFGAVSRPLSRRERLDRVKRISALAQAC